MFFWNSLAFLVIQWMLAIWSLVPLPFLNPAWTSGTLDISKIIYHAQYLVKLFLLMNVKILIPSCFRFLIFIVNNFYIKFNHVIITTVVYFERYVFPIWNQSFVPCPVLTVASWPAYRLLKRQVRLSGIPISFRIFHSLLWSTQSKALA